MKKSCSCHLFSWSWQAKVNEKYFLLKTLKDWMDSTRRLLQSWKRSGFLTNVCLLLFLLVLQNSVYTSFCIIDVLLFLSSLSYWQVVNWLEGPGSEQLRTQWGIGDSIRASQALQQKHEEIESQHSVRFPIPFSSIKIILNTCSYEQCILVIGI